MKMPNTHLSLLLFITLFTFNNIRASVNDHYTLVTSPKELTPDDEFIIVDKEDKLTVGTYVESMKRFDSCDITIDGDNAIIANPTTTTFTLEKSESNYYIKTKESGKYLSGNAEDVGSILFDDISNKTKKELCQATISFNKTDHSAKIEISKNKYKYFSCNNSITNPSYIWKMYTANPTKPYIYKKASAGTNINISLNGIDANAKNVTTLKEHDGKNIDKIILRRSFAADGGWYTLCLPFALTTDDIATTFKGALFYDFKGVTIKADGSALLQFKKVTETVAGVPYMVMPRENVSNPVFTNKTITATAQTILQTCSANDGTELTYSFIGVFDPALLSDKNIRFIGGDEGTELLMPVGEGTIKGLRAYFLFPNSSEGTITHAKLNIEDDSTTGIISINAVNANHSNETNIYTLSGQQVSKNQKALKPGIYLKNGKKIMVR